MLVDELKRTYKGWDGSKQLTNTANRLVRMYEELCWPPERIKLELDREFKVFENGFDEMLVTGPITVWALCPHHLLPCEFKVIIGCVPAGRVLGLSKFARVSDILARRPIMQEQYSMELVNEIFTRLKPKGVAVFITGSHGCMSSRGIKQNSSVVTSAIKGVFEEHPTRDEFFAIARSKF